MAASDASKPAAREPELGLALSGGGFRAAFFHLGVLARLAECGLLRRVEVISTVSGGSIIGAAYYLYVKDLLENVPDEEIGDEHYVWIVECLQRSFLAGVQKHARARAYASLGRNFRMALPSYSRSLRIGEVYDELFYRPVWENPLFGEPDERSGERIRLRDIVIEPPEASGPFSPLREPRRTNAPVPILLMNATALNTGHNWRFEAVRMGEDRREAEHWVALDRNKRLETTRWDDLPPEHRDVELGTAVAASACVPGLFHPLPLHGLFRYSVDKGPAMAIAVELVDGGVHDNQGVCGLIDTRCREMIVSDASGQMGDLDEPPTRIPASVGRSANGIYGDRVREEQLAGVLQRHPSLLVHLKKGLPALVVSPCGPGKRDPVAAEALAPFFEYPVDAESQAFLSGVRTDLDSFTDVEAYSLAQLGYAMTTNDLPATLRVRGRDEPLAGRWDFAVVAGALNDGRDDVHRHLAAARNRFFKPVHLSRALKWALFAAAVLAAAAFVFALARADVGLGSVWDALVVPVPLLAILVAVLLLVLYLRTKFKLAPVRRFADFLYSSVGPGLMALPGWAFAWSTLVFNGTFLRAGKTARLGLEDPRATPLPKPPWAPRACPFD